MQLALTYAQGGASAISCLTDARYFQGELAYLTDIKDAFRKRNIDVPVLRKDFILIPTRCWRPVWLVLMPCS